jgi:hypothetical protein
MYWKVDELEVDLVADLTEHPVVTANIRTPSGLVSVMAEPEEKGRTLVLKRFDIHSASGRNSVGIGNLRTLAQHVMERMDYDELVIEGSPRTSGARPGRIPGRLRFTRRDVPTPQERP